MPETISRKVPAPTKGMGRKYAAAAALDLTYHADAPGNSGGTFWALDAEGTVHLVKVRKVAQRWSTEAGEFIPEHYTAETVADRRAGQEVDPLNNKTITVNSYLWSKSTVWGQRYPGVEVKITVPEIVGGLGPVVVDIPENTAVSLVWNTAD